MTPQQHQLIESEIAVAYLDGLLAGVELAREWFGAHLDEALAGPNGYGLENATVEAKDAIRRMLRATAGVAS